MGERQPKFFEGNLKGVFDTHAHMYDERLVGDDPLRRASEAGIDRIVVPADDIGSSRKAVSYALENTGRFGIDIRAAVGVHPHEASSYGEDAERAIRDMLADREDKRIVALGEIGLDYFYDFSPRDVQRDVFKKQIDIAKEYDVPFILHERDATGDCLDILRECHKDGRLRSVPGVCHCCGMSVEAASELIKMGFYIGFDGPLTFKNNRRGIELLLSVPKDRIVVETDSPYLTPEPNRGLTNEPCYVPFVIGKIADLMEITPEEAALLTSENGKRLFEL